MNQQHDLVMPVTAIDHSRGPAHAPVTIVEYGDFECPTCKQAAPSLKLSTNTELWQRQADDIDINCGEVVDGLSSVQTMGERIFRLMLDTASGRRSKSEIHGYGQSEFVPWQLGAVM